MSDKRKIHIGIDGNEANVVSRVGSNRYAYGILKAIWEVDQTTSYTIYLKSDPVADMPPERPGWSYRVLTPAKLWTQWRLPLDLFTFPRRPHVFYSPGHYAPRKSPIPTVVSVMDLGFLKYPNLFLKLKRGVAQLKSWTEYSVKNADHVIVISENTKKDVVDTYGTDPLKVTIAYPGIGATFSPREPDEVEAMRQKYNLGPKYILYVGTLQPRKNLIRLLKTYEQLPPKFKTYQLVLAGQKGWLYDSLAHALDVSPKKDRIRLTGFVDDADIPAMLGGAACVCLVGLYEGFGMPPAEALACGTIPVVSNNSSLPEVVGEAGILVDPFSIKSMTHGIMSAISLPPEKKRHRLELGKKHIEKFNWQRSAKIIIEVLYDIALHR
jgi:glycosyltransferase involved in cell wall biosynthesis